MPYGTAVANEIKAAPGVDTGPRERHRHAGGVTLAPRTVTEGGIETSVGAQSMYDCPLDALLGPDPAIGYLAGTQGSRGDRASVARSRYEAGMRLRRMFVNAGLVAVRAYDHNATRGQAEMSDRQALARREYNDVMRKMGEMGTIVSGPCCFDQMPTNERWLSNVRRGLDRLCEVVL